MGFVDDFYYGQCRLICKTTSSADNGKTVSIASSGGRTWSGTMASLQCEFMLPPRDVYTVSLIDNGNTQYTTKVIAGYGECLEVMVGLDKTTPLGIKAIVNAGLESSFFTAGDYVMVKENNADVRYDVVHVGYRLALYGHNIILQRHDCQDNMKQMNSSNTNAGGYKASLMASYLDNEVFSSYSQEWQDAISEITFQASIGSQSATLQNEEHKVWLPMEYNIFGATTYAAGTEHTTGGNEQFAYYATAANRIKSINGAACGWVECSPRVGASTAFCGVATSGAASYGNASDASGVAPCFMIAADAA